MVSDQLGINITHWIERCLPPGWVLENIAIGQKFDRDFLSVHVLLMFKGKDNYSTFHPEFMLFFDRQLGRRNDNGKTTMFDMTTTLSRSRWMELEGLAQKIVDQQTYEWFENIDDK